MVCNTKATKGHLCSILFLLVAGFFLYYSLAYPNNAFAQISNNTGYKNDFVIKTGGYEFEVETVATTFVDDVKFSKEEKKLTFLVDNSLENNLMEIQIPANLIGGNMTVFLDDNQIHPQIRQSEKTTLIVIEFEGKESHKIEVYGTSYLPEFSRIATVIVLASTIAVMILFHRIHLKRSTKYKFSKNFS